MTRRQSRRGRIVRSLSIFLLFSLIVSCVPAADLTQSGAYQLRLAAITGPQSFGLTAWVLRSLALKAGQWARGDSRVPADPAQRRALVDNFFARGEELNDLEAELREAGNRREDPQRIAELEQRIRALQVQRAQQAPAIESILQAQVEAYLASQGISLIDIGGRVLPPVAARLESLPQVLVVSPREEIAIKSQVALRHDVGPLTAAILEDAVDTALNVRSLVVPIGGYSTYPTMIAATAPRDFVIEAIAHEWCHTYLFFRPLGWNYGSSPQLTAMNETVCSIVGGDIGRAVLEREYGVPPRTPPWAATPTPTPTTTATPESSFNVNRELRRIFLQADELLRKKDIAGAEAIMEEGRQRLAAHGFYLRKLNQAFFAFYGSYAEGPDAISIDPVGEDLRELRRRSPNVKVFLETVASMASYDDLTRALGRR